MRVSVLYFGVLRELVGTAEETVELESGTTAGGLIGIVQARVSRQSELWGSLAVAVNREYAGRGTVLADGDEVALLPPVSGGG